MTDKVPSETQKLADSISGHAIQRAESLKASSFWLKLAVVAGGGLATAMQFCNPEDSKYRPDQLIGITAAIVVCILAGVLLRFDNDASEHLDCARKALDHAKDVVADADQIRRESAAASSVRDADDEQLEADFGRLQSSLLSLQTMRTVIERAVIGGTPTDKLVETLLLTTQQQLEIALGFNTEDDFSICIYKYQDAPKGELRLLKCLAQHRPVQCDLAHTRPFAEGVGIVGVAHANKAGFVFPDLMAEGVVSLFDMVADDDPVRKAAAKDKYRSMTVQPILVDNDEKAWGVCTATVDRVGHFSLNQRATSPHHAPVKLLADMIALAVAVRRVPTAASKK